MIISSAYDLRIEDWARVHASEERQCWDVTPWLTRALAFHEEFLSLATGKVASSFSHTIAQNCLGVCLFTELAFYGRYGAFLKPRTKVVGELWIDQALAQAKRLHQLAPTESDDDVPLRILTVAQGRRQIENGSGVIAPRALALIGGVSEGRIRNLMFGTGALFNSIEGNIPVSNAINWLDGRSAYWPSIWQCDEDSSLGNDLVMVPQAADGTVFHPGLRRRNGYTLGEKGSEVTIEGYDDALAAITRMREPRWRRPNAEGNWGIVKGTSWISLPRRDLNQLRT